MTAGGIGFGFVAGLLSTLSPCVLPLLPLVLGGAATAHRAGPLLLAAGVALSFTAIGLFVATVGFALGLDAEVFRDASAILLAAMGLALLSLALQRRFVMAGGGMGNAGHRLLERLAPSGPGGQFVVGLVLGAVWSPCAGPTLGAASMLAAQGKDLVAVAGVMLVFGIGAALPLLVVAALSRHALLRWRGRMMKAGQTGRLVLGAGALAIAAMILTGADHRIEAALVAASPDWLTDFTTQY